MALKKPLLSLLAVCIMAPAAHAAFCVNNFSLEQAQNALKIAAASRDNGIANNYDYLMAEKSFLELKVCLDAGNTENQDDRYGYPSLKALASNTVSRLAIAQAILKSGQAMQSEVDLVSAEKDMRSRACASSLKEAQALSYNGVINLLELQMVKDTCAILK